MNTNIIGKLSDECYIQLFKGYKSEQQELKTFV